MESIKLFLEGNRSKKGVNSSITCNLDLHGNRRLYTDTNIDEAVSAMDVYNDERKKSNKVRLICEINPLCTNALFNPVTEIVKNEGSDDVELLNYSPRENSEITSIDGGFHPIKPKTITWSYTTSFDTADNNTFTWTAYEAIRDTQLSSDLFGYDYHCGVDIFNNHILRSNTMKIVSYNEAMSYKPSFNGKRSLSSKTNSDGTFEQGIDMSVTGDTNNYHVYLDTNFNTIDDWARDSMGNIILDTFYYQSVNDKNITYNLDVKSVTKINESKLNVTFKMTLNDQTSDSSVFGAVDKGKKINVYLRSDFFYGLDDRRHGTDSRSGNTGVLSAKIDYSYKNGNEILFTKEVDLNNGVSNVLYNFYPYKDGSFKINYSNVQVALITEGIDRTFGPITYNKAFLYDGVNEKDVVQSTVEAILADSWTSASYLYQKYDAFDFEEAIDKKLIENNGWFGFENVSKLPTLDMAEKYKSHPEKRIDISKPLNNKMNGAFVDMYPGRDLFSFTPKYNSYRKRIEKNWDYCLTYPSSSTTDVNILDKTTKGLRVQSFNEYVTDDNGRDVITIYSIAQHGLKAGDKINLYSTVEENGNSVAKLIYGEAVVSDVYDKYIFQIYKNAHNISRYWYEVKDEDFVRERFEVKIDGKIVGYHLSSLNKEAFYKEDVTDTNVPNTYQMVPNTRRISLDSSTLQLSFKKVVNNVECEYYVRIFSKIPNFKFSKEEINDETLYNKRSTLISKYSDKSHHFDSQINKLAFAKNIYGDNVSEIVFVDDIDLSHLKDNLGRPLTDIYLTIVKRNKGYKEWYGVKGAEINIKSDKVEYSHCFGKNTCGFRLSDDMIYNYGYNDIRTICNDREGLIMSNIDKQTAGNDADEIDFDDCHNFYGDLCCYSPSSVYEETIQPVLNRFNTAQRELKSTDKSYSAFSSVAFDTIVGDNTTVGFYDPFTGCVHTTKEKRNVTPRNEGYYYQPHYRIRVKTVSSSQTERYPLFYTMLETSYNSKKNEYEMWIDGDSDFSVNDKFSIYDKDKNIIYNCVVTKPLTTKKFRFKAYDENGDDADVIDFTDISRYVVSKKDETIPSYAMMVKDGSCLYRWREILQNGFDSNSDVETYPFTNGALYINKPINFFLRRQDPFEEGVNTIDVNSSDNPLNYEPKGEEVSSDNIEYNNNYVSQKDMKEC